MEDFTYKVKYKKVNKKSIWLKACKYSSSRNKFVQKYILLHVFITIR